MAAPKGLLVPVLRNANAMSFAEVEKTIGALGRKAKEGTMSIDDMAGGTFTVTNGGIFGSLLSTPIINAPQVSKQARERDRDRERERERPSLPFLPFLSFLSFQ